VAETLRCFVLHYFKHVAGTGSTTCDKIKNRRAIA